MAQFKKPSKKATIITAAIIVILLIIAATGTVVFLRDRGQTEAFEANQVGTQSAEGTQNEEQVATGEEQTTPEEPEGTEGEVATEGEEGTDVAETTEGTANEGTTDTTTATATTGTRPAGTTTATEEIEESTITRTETVEIPERKVSEGHEVWWEPMSITAAIASANINPADDSIVDVEKTGDETVIQGEAINYSITVTNKTAEKLEGIEVKDELDEANLDLSSIEFKTEPAGTLYGNVIKWNVDIEANSSVTIEFSINVKTSVEPGTEITNEAIANGEVSKEVAITEVEQATTEVSGEKIWDDNSDQDGKRPEDITIYLNKTVNETTTRLENVEPEMVKEGDKWAYKFTNLPKYENGEEIVYSVGEDAVADYTTTIEGTTITNTHTPELYNEDGVLSGEKVWVDNNDQDGIRPDSVTIYLDKEVDGVKTEGIKTTTTNENWEYSFTDLPKYENGYEITYSVREEAVEDYTTTIEGTTITNTHTPELYNEDGVLSGEKVWVDNNDQDGIRPDSVTIYLDKEVDGVKTEGIKTTTTNENWEYSFTDLPKYENGKEIAYSVREEAVTDYTTTIEGTTITNTHTPELYNEDGVLSGEKVWVDNNDQDGIRPDSVTIYLDKEVDGVKTEGIKTTTTNENWEYRFTDLPKYENGKEIVYSVREEAVTDYTTTIEGTTITNTHTPELYNEDGVLSGTKVWVDNNDQDGIRPDSVTIYLDKEVDGVKTEGIKTTTTNENWEYSFTDLPKYENGKEITYSVREAVVPEYTTTIDGTTVTNTHTPDLYNENGKLTGTKTWVEGENQEGYRPEAIYIRLYANGERAVDVNGNPVADLRVNGDSNVWTYEFNNLPENKNGNPITYTVKELDVNGNPIENNGNYNDGYVTTYDGNNITNTHKASDISIEKNVAELKGDSFVTISDEALKNVMHSVGDEVWYAITVTNNSDFAEENAVVKDTLVNGLTYVEAKINNVNTDARREVSVNGQEITWTTDLAKGETKTLYVKVRINQNAISEENFVSSEVTGSVTDWWKTDNSHREIGAQQKTAQLFIRLDGEILEGDENEGHDTDLYTDCVGTVELTDKNWNGDYAYTTEQNAIKVGADSTPTTVEGYSRLNYNIFQFVVGGTDLDTIAQRINNFVGDNGERVHFDPETQMIVCYVLKYEDDGYHIDAVIRDRVQTKVDLYKVGNEAVVNGNRDNVDININDITEITQYKVQKQWVDNGRENERPTSVDVQLYANNVFKDTVSLTAENNWTYTWEELNKKDSNGNNITYTVKEAVINNETAKVFENNEINGNYIVTYENAEGKTTITNTYSEPNIAVEKSRVGDNTAVKYGEEITYNITATNTGTASGKVTIKDELATNMEPRGNVTVETKQLDGRTIATSEMSFDELIKGKEFEVANGTKVVLTFTVTANGYAGEDVNNTADYKKDGEDEFTPTETVKTDLEDTADVVTTTTTEKGQKVILVLDLSGSMKDKIKVGSGWNTKYETKLSLMKSAVSTFLNDFLKNEKNEVMIITYSSSAEMKCDYTNSVQKAYNSIGNWANGGTNIDGGLTLANSKISKEDVENTSVILMTDGIPGYYVDEWGISHSVWAGGNYYDKTAGEETVKAGNTLTNRGVNVYTIGFGVDDKDALDMLKRTASDEKYYYSTFDGDALTEAFESISSTITINYDPVPMSTQDGKITLRSGFEVGQNVEVYYKENYDKENVEDSTPYEIISWNNFINSDYVEYNASEGTLTFDLGAYMKAKGMDKDEELTIRFVRAQTAQTRLSSANVVSFMVDSIADDTINNETVSTYEEKFNEAETNKEETTPVVEEEKTENVETTTPNEETEVVEDDKENETEGTEAGAIESENTTTEEKPAEEPAETETTEGTESVEQETSNINEQKAE